AAKVFEDADSFLAKRVGALRHAWEAAQQALQARPPLKDENEPDPLKDEVDVTGTKYLVAASGYAQTKYFHATTLAQDDPERVKLLQAVANLYDDLELDFADKLPCFDGFIFRG